jgi:hypothetical protein
MDRGGGWDGLGSEPILEVAIVPDTVSKGVAHRPDVVAQTSAVKP